VILRLAHSRKLSGYDAEFLGLAIALGIKMVTLDKGVLKAAPGIAISPATFAAG
jgi:predicted nucleic acid-binding protein